MTKKRSKKQHSTQLAEQPAKRIHLNIEGEHTEEPETTTSTMSPLAQAIQALSQSSMPLNDILAHALQHILANAPSPVLLPATEGKNLITTNHDLRQLLQSAINRQRFEDITSLRTSEISGSFPTYNHLRVSDFSKRCATQQFGSFSMDR